MDQAVNSHCRAACEGEVSSAIFSDYKDGIIGMAIEKVLYERKRHLNFDY